MLVSFQYFACIAISWSNTHTHTSAWEIDLKWARQLSHHLATLYIMHQYYINVHEIHTWTPFAPLHRLHLITDSLSLARSLSPSVSWFSACIRKLSCMPVFSVLRPRPVCQNKTTYNCTLHMYYKYNTSPATINIRHEYLLDTL